MSERVSNADNVIVTIKLIGSKTRTSSALSGARYLLHPPHRTPRTDSIIHLPIFIYSPDSPTGMHVEAWGLNHSLYLPYVMHGRPSVAASFSLRPQDTCSLWDGAHDAGSAGRACVTAAIMGRGGGCCKCSDTHAWTVPGSYWTRQQRVE